MKLVEEPQGSLFPSTPDYPSKQWRLWGPGRTLWCSDDCVHRRQEAWIISKGCLCAPVSQEDRAQSYMKVSERKNKTVFSGGHEADPPVTLLLFTEHYSWKMHHCHPGYLDLLPETSTSHRDKCGTFSNSRWKRRVKNDNGFFIRLFQQNLSHPE